MISVIIPAYNCETTIVEALDSVKNQTYNGRIEVIVVNDGSSDYTGEIVDRYKSRNPSIELKVITQINSGVSKARNQGLRFCKGDYISFLDSDDFWIKDKLEVQMKYFNEGVDFVCALRNNDKIGFPYRFENDFAEITLRKLLIKVVGQTSTAIFKRKVFENTGYFDENQKYSEDANYWMRISFNNRMIILNKELVFTRNAYGQSGLSSNIKKMEEGVQKNIKEMFDLKKITIFEYCLFKFFSKMKYIRRIKKRKNV